MLIITFWLIIIIIPFYYEFAYSNSALNVSYYLIKSFVFYMGIFIDAHI